MLITDYFVKSFSYYIRRTSVFISPSLSLSGCFYWSIQSTNIYDAIKYDTKSTLRTNTTTMCCECQQWRSRVLWLSLSLLLSHTYTDYVSYLRIYVDVACKAMLMIHFVFALPNRTTRVSSFDRGRCCWLVLYIFTYTHTYAHLTQCLSVAVSVSLTHSRRSYNKNRIERSGKNVFVVVVVSAGL